MVTKKQTAVSTAQFSSIKDASYKFQVFGEGQTSTAQYILSQIPKFLENGFSEEQDAEWKEGAQLRYTEKHKGEKYANVNGNWVKESDLTTKDHKFEVVEMTPAYALSLTPHEVGELTKTRGAEYKLLVQDLRTAFSTYYSNSKRNLTKQIKDLIGGKTKKRSENKTCRELIAYLFDDPKNGLEKKLKNLKSKGDPDADIALYRTAKESFLKIMKLA